MLVPWEHKDFRNFKWTDSSLTPDEGLQALTAEVVSLYSVPIDENTTDLLFEGWVAANGTTLRTIEEVNCAYTCLGENNTNCFFHNGTVVAGAMREIRTLRDSMFAYMIDIISIQLAASNNNASNTLKMPNADGTLLYKHNGETHLDGDVFLGEDPTDTVFIPGTVAGNIRLLAHIEGSKIDEGGYGTSCETKPLYWTTMTCEQAVPSILSIGAATCSHYWSVLGITGEDTPIGDWCPMECYKRCHANGTAMRFRNRDMDQFLYGPSGETIGKSSEEIIIAVPEHTSSQVLTLPDNTGDILSSASDYSTLRQLGLLTFLDVEGPTTLTGRTNVGGMLPGGDVLPGTVSGVAPPRRSEVFLDGVITQPDHSGADPTARSMSFGGELFGQQYISGCNQWDYPCLHTPADPLGACGPLGCPETCEVQPVDAAACAAVLLDGTAETCESAGRCTYTPLQLAFGISESCDATYTTPCSAVVPDGKI